MAVLMSDCKEYLHIQVQTPKFQTRHIDSRLAIIFQKNLPQFKLRKFQQSQFWNYQVNNFDKTTVNTTYKL